MLAFIEYLCFFLAKYFRWEFKIDFTFCCLDYFYITFFIVPFSLFKRIPINKINHVLYIIYYITVSFSILEYLDVNIFNIGFTNLIPRPDGSDYDPIFIWGIRSRSFCRIRIFCNVCFVIFSCDLLHGKGTIVSVEKYSIDSIDYISYAICF